MTQRLCLPMTFGRKHKAFQVLWMEAGGGQEEGDRYLVSSENNPLCLFLPNIGALTVLWFPKPLG